MYFEEDMAIWRAWWQEHKAEFSEFAPPEQSEKTSSNKTILWLAIIALLAIFGGVVAWRKK